MNITLNVRQKVRTDTEQNWGTKNPILLSGEIGYISSGEHAGMSKTGDGTTEWSNLPYDKAVAVGGNADTVGGHTVGADVPSNLETTLSDLTTKSDKIAGISSICWETTLTVTPRTTEVPFSWTISVPAGTVSDGTTSHSVTLSSSDSVIAGLYIPSSATADTIKTLKSCWNAIDRIDVNNGSIVLNGFSSVPSTRFSIHLQIHKHDFRGIIAK